MFIDNFGDLIYEYSFILANSKPQLPCNIFMSEAEGNYGPRIKFQYTQNEKYNEKLMSIMTIEDNPRVIGTIGELSNNDIEYLKQFVIKNKDILMKYWNLTTDCITLFENLIY